MSSAGFFVLGATHHTAPLAVRERLALSREAEEALAAELLAARGLRECAILNTCNRVELYGVAEDAAALAQVQAAFCQRQRFEAAEFEKFRLSLQGREAVQHLLEVASGLDSQMLGETEIFGQVKEAYAAAQARGAAGPVLNRIFQKAFQAAKHVRTHTSITAGQVSVANVAVELALNIFGHLEGVRILVLGAGDIGEKTVRALQSRGATSVTVSSRSGERAMQLASAWNATALPFEQREARLADFDVVVCSTSAPQAVVSLAAAEAAVRQRPERPLFFIDLAVPRDVEPGVADLVNVFRYDLDDLARIADQNRAARAAEIDRGRALLRERTEALWTRVEGLLAASASAGSPALGSRHPA